MSLSELFSESISEDKNERLAQIQKTEDEKQNKLNANNQKIENAKSAAELEKQNNSTVYYTKQKKYILATIAIIVGFIYFVIKVIGN